MVQGQCGLFTAVCQRLGQCLPCGGAQGGSPVRAQRSVTVPRALVGGALGAGGGWVLMGVARPCLHA